MSRPLPLLLCLLAAPVAALASGSQPAPPAAAVPPGDSGINIEQYNIGKVLFERAESLPAGASHAAPPKNSDGIKDISSETRMRMRDRLSSLLSLLPKRVAEKIPEFPALAWSITPDELILLEYYCEKRFKTRLTTPWE